MSETENFLETALNRAGLDPEKFPNLLESYEYSECFIHSARAEMQAKLSADNANLDVVAFGSVARREMTRASDFDFLVITYGIGLRSAEQQFLDQAEELRSKLPDSTDGEQSELRQPGSTGMFGIIVPAQEFYQNVGLQADTNHSHSRRMLLLEESVSLGRPDLHCKLLDVALDRYVSCHEFKASKPPRFLLNDILRYWQTIAVDYQAKIPGKPPYGVRYLKLRISRKLVFAASLAPLCLCQRKSSADELKNHLLYSFTQPALIRFLELAQVFEGNQKALDCIETCLCVADEFSGRLRDEQWRETVEHAAKNGTSWETPDFIVAREASKELQCSLVRLFSLPPLLEFKDAYMLF
jgi:predicted nucleotidyltransferase